MSTDSPQRILEYLKQSGHASVAQLSETLGLTSVTIRHHLEALRSDGLVAEPTARRKSGPGRPQMMYQITPAADALMPRNYGELCHCLLEAIPDSRIQDLELVLIQTGSELATAVASGSGPRAAMEHLQQRGYFPSLKQQDSGLVLELANCPYLEVAKQSPELCQFDRALIEGLFGEKVEMRGRIVNQQPVCTFHIGS